MSVRQVKRTNRKTGRKATYWMVDVDLQGPDGKRLDRVRKVSPVQSRRGAEQYERELRDALLSGTYGREEEEKPKAPTVAEFSKEFIETYARTNNKPSEVSSKAYTFEHHINPILGARRLDEVDTRAIEHYKAAMLNRPKSPLKAKTVNNHLTMIGKMLSLAVEWNLIQHAPRMKWLKAPEPEFDFLDFAEAERLSHAMVPEDAEWQTMIVVALKTGLRLGELLALRWEDVDLVAGRLVVRQAVARGIVGTPKSGKSREVPLSRDCVAALKAHRHLRGELVFCDLDGKMHPKSMCKRPIWRACKRAGLRLIQWHVLRHTFASHLVMRGVPLKAVQELLGHATIEMTERYAHLSPDVRRQAVAVLDLPPNHGNLTASGGGNRAN